MLRYWETEFEALSPGKSKSGQRVYSQDELGVIRRIKELLYEEGYTIAGAKKRLQAELEDGRAFGETDVEGELSEEAVAGDEPPAISIGGDEATDAAAEDRREAGGLSGASSNDAPGAVEPPGVVEVSSPAEPEQPDEPVSPSRPARTRRRRAAAASSATHAAPAIAHQPPATAVDSAVTQRVEILEHGLRRVLDEVRHLRELLADPGADG